MTIHISSLSLEILTIILEKVGNPSATAPVCKALNEATDTIYLNLFNDYNAEPDLASFFKRSIDICPQDDKKSVVKKVYELVVQEGLILPKGKEKVEGSLTSGTNKLSALRLAEIAKDINLKKAQDVIKVFDAIAWHLPAAEAFEEKSQHLKELELAKAFSDWMRNDAELDGSLLASIDTFPYLIGKDLHFLPLEIGYLNNLKLLDLSNNQLQYLPKEIGNLIHLETLRLNGNKLQHLPKEIGNLINLQVLYLHCNGLQEIPASIGRLVNLKTLWLSCNEDLKELPETMGNLINLTELHVSGNRNIKIPHSVYELKNLRTVVH
jgi:Leucine-rich repeat (LRR) protein